MPRPHRCPKQDGRLYRVRPLRNPRLPSGPSAHVYTHAYGARLHACVCVCLADLQRLSSPSSVVLTHTSTHVPMRMSIACHPAIPAILATKPNTHVHTQVRTPVECTEASVLAHPCLWSVQAAGPYDRPPTHCPRKRGRARSSGSSALVFCQRQRPHESADAGGATAVGNAVPITAGIGSTGEV